MQPQVWKETMTQWETPSGETYFLSAGENPGEGYRDCGPSRGWYCRLSAPGYLDCTDTDGPFKTEAEAEEHLIEMYGDSAIEELEHE